MYVIYNTNTTCFPPRMNAEYETERAAKAAITRNVNKGVLKNKEDWTVAEKVDFHKNIEQTRTVRNLMSNEEVTIPMNTPVHLDPSKETYWSM